MDNRYAQPYTATLFNERGVAGCAWFVSLLMVTVLGIMNAKKATAGRRSEAFLYGAAVGLLTLKALDLMVEVVGTPCFLEIKELPGVLWTMLFLAGTPGVFRVFPVIGLALLAWWVIGRLRFSYSTRARAVIVKCCILNAVCAGLFFRAVKQLSGVVIS